MLRRRQGYLTLVQRFNVSFRITAVARTSNKSLEQVNFKEQKHCPERNFYYITVFKISYLSSRYMLGVKRNDVSGNASGALLRRTRVLRYIYLIPSEL